MTREASAVLNICVLDLTRWLDFDVLLDTTRRDEFVRANPFQSRADVRKGVSNLLAEFEGCYVRFGDQVLHTPRDDYETLLHNVRMRRVAAPDYRPFADAVDDLLDAVADETSDVLWLYGAGDPADVQSGAAQIAAIVLGIMQRLKPLPEGMHRRRPKPLLGFCMMTPIMAYLHMHGLVRAVHAPLLVDFSIGLRDPKDTLAGLTLDRVHHVLRGTGGPLNAALPGATPINDLARSRPATINGFVLGGLLQATSEYLRVALKQSPGLEAVELPLPRAPLLLLEFLELTDDADRLEEIATWIERGLLRPAAIILGYEGRRERGASFDPSAAAPRVRTASFEAAVKRLAATGQTVQAPVFRSAPFGHRDPNLAVPFGHATLYWSNTGVLALDYSSPDAQV